MGWDSGVKTGDRFIHERYLPGQGYYRHHLHLARRNLKRTHKVSECLKIHINDAVACENETAPNLSN